MATAFRLVRAVLLCQPGGFCGNTVLVETPPVLAPAPPPLPEVAPRSVWRWAAMLIILAAYPLMLEGIRKVIDRAMPMSSGEGTMLPADTLGLVLACGENLGMFGLWFAVAWLFGRPGWDDLQARVRRPWLTLILGAAWSVGLRIIVLLLVVVAMLVVVAFNGGASITPDSIQSMRPQVEKLIDFEALRNPVYLLLTLTLVSFVLAGLREELWRAGMLAAILRLLPEGWRGRRGQVLAVVVTSIIFGLAHLPQGWGGVVLTGFLGLGLGAVMLFHRSLWVAVLAHGFFDATTFFFLWFLDRFHLLDEVLKAIPK